MKQPLFSILIPTTGRADIADYALKSVLAQTFQDFEIVIADSATSGGMNVPRGGFSDPRIHYYRTPADGPFIPWDYSEAKARGEYILWLDDDNYLLPFALETFARAVNRTHADVITTSHLYYYDDHHPRRSLRNTIGILPFTGEERFVDCRKILRSLYSFEKRGPGSKLPRLHPSAVMVARRLTQQVRSRLGFVVFHSMPSAHPHPMQFAFARTCYFIDWPTVIIGRLGESMSQTWAARANRRFRERAFTPRQSPFIGYTRLNARLENFLTARHLLPDILGSIPVDYVAFIALYIRALSYLDTDFQTAFRNWKNLFTFLRSQQDQKTTRKLNRDALRHVILSALISIARRMGLYLLWRRIIEVRERARLNSSPFVKKMQGEREFEIPIPASYNIHSVSTLAPHLEEIIQKTTGKSFVPPVTQK